MSSSFYNLTDFFWSMPYSVEVLHHGIDDPYINPALLSVTVPGPSGEPTPQINVPLSVGPQPQLSTYEALPHGLGTGGHGAHATIQPIHRQDRGSRNINRKVRRAQAFCTDCKIGFGRTQDLARHRKDMHEKPRKCLFCSFKWTLGRPHHIKAHLLAKHSERFTSENLVTIQALRGQMVVAFLDAYN